MLLAEAFWPSTFAGWVAPLALLAATIVGLRSFIKNNRIKAAEIVLAIENGYSQHVPVLLKLEYIEDYRKCFQPALEAALADGTPEYEKEESNAIDDLERCLRFFVVCSAVQRLRVDAGTVDRLCSYYLRVLYTPDTRSELWQYIRRYWPVIYFWAPLAGKPFPKRCVIHLRQLPERVRFWWNGVGPRE